MQGVLGWVFLEKLWPITLDYESNIFLNMCRPWDKFWKEEWWFDEAAGSWAYLSHATPFVMHFNGFNFRHHMKPAYKRLLKWNHDHKPHIRLDNLTVYLNGVPVLLDELCGNSLK